MSAEEPSLYIYTHLYYYYYYSNVNAKTVGPKKILSELWCVFINHCLVDEVVDETLL